MSMTIERIYELSDDLQTLLVGDKPQKIIYTEIYPEKTIVDGIPSNAFVLRAKSFYKVQLSESYSNKNFVLDSKLSACGLIYNYNQITDQLFIYNCTKNVIYIDKDYSIGSVYDG